MSCIVTAGAFVPCFVLIQSRLNSSQFLYLIFPVGLVSDVKIAGATPKFFQLHAGTMVSTYVWPYSYPAFPFSPINWHCAVTLLLCTCASIFPGEKESSRRFKGT